VSSAGVGTGIVVEGRRARDWLASINAWFTAASVGAAPYGASGQALKLRSTPSP
jgi:hypothetical protein